MPEIAPTQIGPGDIIGGLTDIVGAAAGSAVSGLLNSFSEWLWAAGLEILQTGVELADNVGTVDLNLTSGPLAAVWPVTLGIGLALAGILFYVQLVTVSARGGRGLLRAVQGCAQFGIALAASAAVFALVLAAADGITEFILAEGLDAENFAAAFDQNGFSDTTANAVKGPALALLSLFGVIPIALGFAFENVMRAATIYLLVAVIPITAAGLLSGNTRSWFWKTANWALAAIAIKPVMALALWIGVAITGAGAGLAQLITGLALMFVSLWAPLALFKLFAFTSTAATDAFKGGWSQADVTNPAGSGSDTSSSRATTTMESSTDARYDSVSSSDSTATSSSSGSGGGSGLNGSGFHGVGFHGGDDTDYDIDQDRGRDTDGYDTGRGGHNLTQDDLGDAAGNATPDPTGSRPAAGGGDPSTTGTAGEPAGPPRSATGGGAGGAGGGLTAEEAATLTM